MVTYPYVAPILCFLEIPVFDAYPDMVEDETMISFQLRSGLDALAVEYEKNAIIVKVDTDEEHQFAQDMQVRGLPTLFFISPDPNKEAIRTEGLIPIQMMRDILDNEM
ncbi:hypothetical protein Gotur_020317 [Gossypium turneri]